MRHVDGTVEQADSDFHPASRAGHQFIEPHHAQDGLCVRRRVTPTVDGRVQADDVARVVPMAHDAQDSVGGEVSPLTKRRCHCRRGASRTSPTVVESLDSMRWLVLTMPTSSRLATAWSVFLFRRAKPTADRVEAVVGVPLEATYDVERGSIQGLLTYLPCRWGSLENGRPRQRQHLRPNPVRGRPSMVVARPGTTDGILMPAPCAVRDQGPPFQCSMRWWSGWKPCRIPQSTAWVRLDTSILRYRLRM